jgi:hypothetical protein
MEGGDGVFEEELELDPPELLPDGPTGLLL